MGELIRLFLRLGLTAFGGPAAHLVLMEREAVERRKWLSRERFLDLAGACNLLPGPSSTQVAMALGYVRAGWLGLTIAGVCFIVPASLATLALAWVYKQFGRLPQIQGLLYGAKPVMVAIVIQAIWRLGRLALRRRQFLLLAFACFVAAVAGAPPLLLLLACGSLAALPAAQRHWRKDARGGYGALGLSVGGAWTAAAPASATGLLPILLVFLKLGVAVFGSGYVLLVFLQADLVDRLHWITQTQLLDAVTAGQVTPGPVFATATFLGYLLHGYGGAAVATVAIFLPSFFLAGAVGALAARMRQSRIAAAFLDGVNAAAVALMAAVGLLLGRAALVDVWTCVIGAASAPLLLRFKINATWVLAAASVLGLLLHIQR